MTKFETLLVLIAYTVIVYGVGIARGIMLERAEKPPGRDLR